MTANLPDPGPSRHASQPSCLAVEPRNMEISAERRARLLAAFDCLPPVKRADLLELVESWAWSGYVDPDKREARDVLAEVYRLARFDQP